MVRVGEQRERQGVLLPEADVRGLVVGTDATDDGAPLLEDLVVIDVKVEDVPD